MSFFTGMEKVAFMRDFFKMRLAAHRRLGKGLGPVPMDPTKARLQARADLKLK